MAENRKSVDWKIAKHFWDVSKTQKKEFYLSWLIPFQSIFANTIAPLIIGKILASLLVPAANVNGLIIWFAIVAVIVFFTNYVGFQAFMKGQAITIAKLQEEVLSMLLRRGTSFHNNQVSGKLVTEASDYPSAYMQLAGSFYTAIVPYGVAMVSGIAVLLYHSLALGALIAAMTVMAIGSGFMLRKRLAPLRRERIQRQRDVTSHFADTIVNIQAVKTFARERDELQEHRSKGGKLLNVRLKNWLLFSRSGSYRIAIMYLFQLIFIMSIVALVRRDPSLLAAGIFAFSYVVTLSNRLFEVSTILRTIEESFVLAEPMTRAINEAPEVQDIAGAAELRVATGRIDIEDVSFKYNDNSGDANVFSDLNISILAGQKVGLVGPSGGGKSTITRLLLRFEDVQEGAIRIDGENIAEVTQESLRKSIAYVPQESLLFHRTIAENIAYGNPDADEAAIIKAARDAYAHDFITGLPDGYDTVVGERGVKLSGGQRQRIAIARAMLKDAPILLLDEATSALDSESEKVIQRALQELMEDRTAVVIAHRLSTIQAMDRIVVLDKGKVVEDGTHKELLKQQGLYARLWAHQSGGFLED